MGRETRINPEAGRPTPVSKIELSTANIGLRIAFLALFLTMAIFAFGYGFKAITTVNSGWNEIDGSGKGVNCSSDFVFKYNLKTGDGNAIVTRKTLSLLYTELCDKAYAYLNVDGDCEGNSNVYRLNTNPNTVLTVDEPLYEMLEKVISSGSRYIYLGPIYEYYDNIFYCNEDSVAKEYDGGYNTEIRVCYQKLAEYANRPECVDLKLLGDNQVMLCASEEYLAYLKQNEFRNIIDFYWMKDAFIIDYIADSLIEAGYSDGIISSFEGYVRNLGNDGEEFYINLYDEDETQYKYAGPKALAYLKDFIHVDSDTKYIYVYEDGVIRTPYISLTNGDNETTYGYMVATADKCSDMVLGLAPAYIEGGSVPAGIEILYSR